MTTNATTYGTPNTVGPVAERAIVTTVRVEEGPGHDHVHVWNRGGKAGVLTVEKGDGHRIAARLLPAALARARGETP